jgi:hypothetical protein
VVKSSERPLALVTPETRPAVGDSFRNGAASLARRERAAIWWLRA